MKTTLIAAALLLSSMAGAQTASTDNLNFRLDGCAVSGKKLLCNLTYSLTQLDQATISFSDTKIFTNEGNQVLPDTITVGGSMRDSLAVFSYRFNATAYKNIPVKLVIDTQLPINTSSIRAIVLNVGTNSSDISTIRFNNIPVRNVSPPASTQTPAVVNTGLFNVQLSNCKGGANGSYICTGATVTPRK